MKSFIKTSTQTIWKSLFLILLLSLAGFLISSCDTNFRGDISYSVYGYVTDAESLKPIVNAEILLGNLVMDSTDTSGYYYYTSFGANRYVKITAKAEGYLPLQKEVFVPKNSQVRVDFALTKE